MRLLKWADNLDTLIQPESIRTCRLWLQFPAWGTASPNNVMDSVLGWPGGGEKGALQKTKCQDATCSSAAPPIPSHTHPCCHCTDSVEREAEWLWPGWRGVQPESYRAQ